MEEFRAGLRNRMAGPPVVEHLDVRGAAYTGRPGGVILRG
jgi:hypothetical protein